MLEPTEDKLEILFRHYNLEGSENFRCLARLLQAVEAYDQDGEDVSETTLLASLKWRGLDFVQICTNNSRILDKPVY